MKNVSWFLMLVLMASACQLQNEEVFDSGRASAANIEDYSVSSSTSNGQTFTFNITLNAGAKDISHVMFNFSDCDGNPLNLGNVESFTVNGEDAMGLLKAGTGQGDECSSVSDANSIKLDEGYGDNIEVVITLDEKSSGGSVYIKAGSEQSGAGCFGAYEFEGNCEDDEPCYEYSEETAWSNGDRYVTRGNWAMYTEYAEGSVSIYAGQHHLAGTATFSAVEDGMVTITIALADGWSLQDNGDNNVKIQGYADAPTGTPSPGRFTTYKGNDLEVTVPAAAFYGIHLDVRTLVEVECPVD
jgi:hypothetical protein